MSFTLPPAPQFEKKLQEALGVQVDVTWKNKVGSTNFELMQALKKNPKLPPQLFGANFQSSGKGRNGKSFVTKMGQSLLFSLGLCINLPFKCLPLLPIAFGVSSCNALRAHLPEYQQQHLTLKWPNDLMWQDAKLSGILTECSFIEHTADNSASIAVVVGQGINLSGGQQLSKEHQRPITDINSIGFNSPPEQILSQIIAQWMDLIAHFPQSSIDSLLTFNSMNYLNNQLVDVFEQDRWMLSGKAIGLDEFGRLVIDTGLGFSPVTAGDVSIRKRNIYG